MSAGDDATACLVRLARNEDWPGIWPLLQAMGHVDSEAGARWRFRRIIGDDRQYLPVALLAGQVAGYAWAHQGPFHLRSGSSSVRLNDLFVAPEWRRRGIARQLLQAVRQ